jgi:hypothetical protein
VSRVTSEILALITCSGGPSEPSSFTKNMNFTIKLATVMYIFKKNPSERGTRWRSWLSYCATNRKVAGSILDYVVGIFH